ncbi:hypothetical protein NHE_0297 [Neorickettsia helminthoeca str. Oregon]|uniref:Uncharacterized protein n=1 Tax=Neorickettsia helminthoeca str. Oregon TaxID=1286528 RepID=X5H3W3_9RICK|nr:hypothetical protein [Neorickettsia helminthoeca]AHX11256.1 hypothetical protein NHE_0297 [Neorickettsia helminthoeca str. Oregon]
MINKRKQSWCFERSDIVDVRPSFYKVFIRKTATDLDFTGIKKLATEILKLKVTEVNSLYDSLAQQSEWVLGTYSADLAETIVKDLSSSFRNCGLDLSISPIGE